MCKMHACNYLRGQTLKFEVHRFKITKYYTQITLYSFFSYLHLLNYCKKLQIIIHKSYQLALIYKFVFSKYFGLFS